MNFKSILFCTFALMGTCHGAHSSQETITRHESGDIVTFEARRSDYDMTRTATYNSRTGEYSYCWSVKFITAIGTPGTESFRSQVDDITVRGIPGTDFDPKSFFHYFKAVYERRLSEPK